MVGASDWGLVAGRWLALWLHRSIPRSPGTPEGRLLAVDSWGRTGVILDGGHRQAANVEIQLPGLVPLALVGEGSDRISTDADRDRIMAELGDWHESDPPAPAPMVDVQARKAAKLDKATCPEAGMIEADTTIKGDEHGNA